MDVTLKARAVDLPGGSATKRGTTPEPEVTVKVLAAGTTLPGTVKEPASESRGISAGTDISWDSSMVCSVQLDSNKTRGGLRAADNFEFPLLKRSEWLSQYNPRLVRLEAGRGATPPRLAWEGGLRGGSITILRGTIAAVENTPTGNFELIVRTLGDRTLWFRADEFGISLEKWAEAINDAAHRAPELDHADIPRSQSFLQAGLQGWGNRASRETE